MEITIHAPAKINLRLRVTGKREDGYHLIQSLFAKVSLHDTLTFRRRGDDRIELSCDDPSLPSDGRNLAMKAAMAMREKAGGKCGVSVHLEKRIPVAAGLGGGSSDAAAALLALNRIWDAGLGMEELSAMAQKLGADVPFFLHGPMAWVEGIGERITPLAPAKGLPVLLVNPGFPISAAEAYKGASFDFAPPEEKGTIIEAAIGADPEKVALWMENDLEPWAMERHPSLAELKRALLESGPRPLKVAMSGSGPTLMALYPDGWAMKRAAEALKGAAVFVYPAFTLA